MNPIFDSKEFSNNQKRFLPDRVHYRLYSFPSSHCCPSERDWNRPNVSENTCLLGTAAVVVCGWSEHSWWLGSGEEQSRNRRIPFVCLLSGLGLYMFHQLNEFLARP